MSKPVLILLQITPVTVLPYLVSTPVKKKKKINKFEMVSYVPMQTRLCDSERCTNIIRKLLGRGQQIAENLEE